MDEENKFILNLTRLCGSINSVTIEIMLDILSYIQDNSVTEAQFIESSYLGSILHHDEIIHRDWLHICSLQDLIDTYEEGKENGYENDFLVILRQKHKNARKFLENNDIKQQIKTLIEVRKQKMENKMIWNAVNSILDLVKHYPDSKLANMILPVLPEIIKCIPINNSE